MSEFALSSDAAPAAAVSRARRLATLALFDRLFHKLTFSAAIIVLLLLGASLFRWSRGRYRRSRPSDLAFSRRNHGTRSLKFRRDGRDLWHRGDVAYCNAGRGSRGLGVAVFLTELCPHTLRRPIGMAIELLAGIPSIIYGIWGLFVLAPFLQQYVQPALISAFADTPLLSTLFAGPPMASACSPRTHSRRDGAAFIASISRDVFDTVPPVLKEAASGIGCTTWEVMAHVVLPYTRVGVIGGVMLGLGRALGETMAVTFVIGNAHKISGSIIAPGTTISATIANEFTEAVGDIYTSSLIELGLILFVITFVVLACARLLLMRIEHKAGA